MLLGRQVEYFDCSHCGYLQTEEPYWLNEAYADAIDSLDTGIMWRNRLNTERVLLTLTSLGIGNARVLDHAGGHGILVRMLRDAGIDAFWQDKYCANLLARGFEADGGRFDLVTSFEVFEHLPRPRIELQAMLERASHVLISTELILGEHAPPFDWWYYGVEHGQHIGFFRSRTIGRLAEKVGAHHSTDGRSLHLISKKAVPCTWKLLLRRPRLSRLLFGGGRASKIWSDFEELRRRRGALGWKP